MAIEKAKSFAKGTVKAVSNGTRDGILGAAAKLPERILPKKAFLSFVPKLTKFCGACGGLPGFLLGCAITHVGTEVVCKCAKTVCGSKKHKHNYPAGGSNMSRQATG